jgi:hypothetical protein
MSVQITTAFVEQYRGNVAHLAQQKGSRLRGAVRMETVTGKTAFFEQIGSVAARQRTSRHSDTPRMDTPHARRRVSLVDYDWADLIDQEDKVRMLIDPASQYAQAAAWAMGRAIDDAIIAAADGTAYTGVDGSTSTAYASGMTVDVQVRDAGVAAADLGLNVAKLIAAKELLDSNDVDPDEERFIALPARQVTSLLKTTKATSSDYTTVKALVEGKIDTFMGFKFIRTQRTGVDSNSDDKCLFWVKSGILLALGKEPTAKISERDDKNYATQVFYSMCIGATRMEETKVGYIECDDDAGPGA